MLGPFLEVGAWLKTLKPSTFDPRKWHRPSFNYITLHYMYMVLMSITASGIIFGARNMAYIDSLFFASGAATQSGLNTININDVLLYQQVTFMLVACVTNPIFINTFVVFVRLYWFEKRFQNIIIESRKWRETRIKTRTKSEAKADLDEAEKGVGHDKLQVMHPVDTDVIEAENSENEKHKSNSTTESGTGSNSSDAIAKEGQLLDGGLARSNTDTTGFHRDIVFADEVRPQRHDLPRRGSSASRLPQQKDAAHHIAFLTKQREEQDNDETLYIPGPRDFDRGEGPQNLRKQRRPSQGASLERVTSTETFPRGDIFGRNRRRRSSQGEEPNQAKPAALPRHATFALGNPVVNVGQSVYHQFRSRTAPTRYRNASPSRADDDLHNDLRKRGRTGTIKSFLTSQTNPDDDTLPYLSYQPTIGRNSKFVNLTEEQREELGGIEYRALKSLAVILVCYFVGFHLLGLLSFLPWIVRSSYVSLLEGEGISATWWGIFTPASCFNDLGFTLTPDSMNSFNFAVWPLLMGSYLIIIGNTGFPCMLRFIIWIVSKLCRKGGGLWEETRFLLDHPRRCFILLFPSPATWWLFWILVFLNGIDLIFFIVLDLNDPVVSSLPPGIRVLDGWFQAASTRTAGFSVVNLAALHPAIQVSYLIMMYISVLPIAISVRRTNVYEEKSLGVYGGDDKDEDDHQQSYVGAHLRRQLSFDLWYIFLGLFIICIVESHRLADLSDTSFTIYSILFEIVSAYGTVGLSLGYPNVDTSFSAQFHTLSKLVIIAMQIRGRHRGLPYALDKAILLPGDKGYKKRQEEHEEAAANATATAPAHHHNNHHHHEAVRMRSNKNGTILDGEDDGFLLGEEGRSATVRSVAKYDGDAASRRGGGGGGGSGSGSGGGGLTRLISNALSAGPTAQKRD